MTILNLGSLNIDRVLAVPRVVRGGETLASSSLAVFAGGKGLNQSVALARAGARVAHIGKIGADGRWLLEKLASEGVDTSAVRESAGPSGQAMIQVDATGQNAIVIVGGANQEITPEEIDESLARFPTAEWLLAQNETSGVEHAIRRARQRGLRVAFNPAPFDTRVLGFPLDLVDLLCVNETEGTAMTGASRPDVILAVLSARLPQCEIVLTLGEQGVKLDSPEGSLHVPAVPVTAIDTTAAGDTFLGYYLAGRTAGLTALDALERAQRAAAICVTRPGAMDSIPRSDEVR